MLRRPADRHLTLEEIADDWSREIQPPRTKSELATELGKAWWRGELHAANGPTRLKLLRALFKTSRAEIPFWVKGEDAPQTSWELPDGGVEVLIAPILCIPSSTPDDWTDEDCVAGYEAIAEQWEDNCFHLIKPMVNAGVSVSAAEFAQWIAKCGHTPPKFWGQINLEAAQQPLVEAVLVMTRSGGRRGRSSVKRDTALAKLRALIAVGEFTRDGINEMSDGELIYQTGAKRTTAREARTRFLSE